MPHGGHARASPLSRSATLYLSPSRPPLGFPLGPLNALRALCEHTRSSVFPHSRQPRLLFSVRHGPLTTVPPFAHATGDRHLHRQRRAAARRDSWLWWLRHRLSCGRHLHVESEVVRRQVSSPLEQALRHSSAPTTHARDHPPPACIRPPERGDASPRHRGLPIHLHRYGLLP